MPKVTEEYFEIKKNTILDTAEKICTTKPLYKLTMKAIVTESGLSPGAVYASFSDIDEVIVALINRLSIEVDIVSDIKLILQNRITPEEKVEGLLTYSINLIHNTSITYGKIFCELQTIITDDVRRKKIDNGLREIHTYGYVFNSLILVIEENIANGYFKPITSKESIFSLILVTLDGFIRDFSLSKSYKIEIPYGVTFEEKDLPNAFAASIIFLLNHVN